MTIAGLQKLTLLDYPKHIACTIFCQGCNLKCPFCHNASLVTGGCQSPISQDEILEFLSKRIGLLDGVCISGGEPLMQDGIIDFLRRIKDLGYKIKLDTNGCFPQRLEEIIDAEIIDYIAMDIKAPRSKYSLSAGKEVDISQICQSIDLIMQSDTDYEFRTTAVKGIHTTMDFKEIAQWISGAKAYYIQQFVDSGDLISSDCSAFNTQEMQTILDSVKPYVPHAELRGL